MPSRGSIKGRSSTITAAFVQAIIPAIEPSDQEVDEALAILGMRRGECFCAYCGATTSEWDHFRPLVENRRPTGYITEIANLVPSCGKCNQSKGNKHWRAWISSAASLSPKTRNVSGLEEKIRKLEAYEGWKKPTKVDFENELPPEDWEQHWANWQRFNELIEEWETHARKIRQKIKEKLIQES